MIFKTIEKTGEIHGLRESGVIPCVRIYPQPYMRVWVHGMGISHEEFIEVAEYIKRLHKGEVSDNES